MQPVDFQQSSQNRLGESPATAAFVADDIAEISLQLDITPHQRDFFSDPGKLFPYNREMGRKAGGHDGSGSGFGNGYLDVHYRIIFS